MIPNEHLSLWSRIQQFVLDDETSANPFSAKLSAQQSWSPAYTKRAIAEYRRFLFLCCISSSGAAPSQPVDEVWHLHLTYTKSYWVDLCQGVLGRELHHFPSAGGPDEDVKHRKWYRDTLALYRETFDGEPPADLWPAPADSWFGAETGATASPEFPRFRWNSAAGLGITGLMVLPFLFIGIEYGTCFPFALGGPHFLVFFALFALVLFASYVIVRLEVNRSLRRLIEEHYPSDVSAFQVAEFLYGKHRAVQAAIVDLMKRRLLELHENRSFRVKAYPSISDGRETNPLMPALAAEEIDSLHSYDDIAVNWYARERFTHPALAALKKLSVAKEPFLQYNAFAVVLYMVATARIIQGIVNGRPFGLLIIETLGLSLVFACVWRVCSKRPVVRWKIEELYEAQLSKLDEEDDQTVSEVVLRGNRANSGFADAAMLMILFDVVTPRGGDTWSDSIISSATDSSCSSGSSCSGGSSCGGSSCGGCSGS